MFRGVKRTHRRVAAAFALLSVAFYACLLPGHLTSQFAAQLHKADLGMFAEAMCAPDSSGPGTPETSCPICKGLASFHMALAPPDAEALSVPPHARPLLVATRDDAAEQAIPKPRSRGPPLPT